MPGRASAGGLGGDLHPGLWGLYPQTLESCKTLERLEAGQAPKLVPDLGEGTKWPWEKGPGRKIVMPLSGGVSFSGGL